MILFLLLIQKISETAVINSNQFKQYLSWGLLGFIFAILISLHSSTMFVMPIVYLIFLIEYSFKNKKTFIKPLFSVLVVLITLIPYWIVEISNQWHNTINIVQLVFSPTGLSSKLSWLIKINRAIFNYLELGDIFLFPGLKLEYLSHFLMAGLAVGALIVYKGGNTIWKYLWLVTILYLYIASSFDGIYHLHFKMLIWLLPIIFTAVIAGYIFDKIQVSSFFKFNVHKIICFILIILTTSISIKQNIFVTVGHLKSKVGSSRVINTIDISNYLTKLPEKTILCVSDKGQRDAYIYIVKYVNKQLINIASNCDVGSYEIQSKYELNNFQTTLKTINLLNQKVIYEDSAGLVTQHLQYYQELQK